MPSLAEQLRGLQALAASGRAAEALPAARALADAHADSPEAAGVLAFVCLCAGNFEEAVPHARRAAAALPNDPDAHANLGMALARTGDMRSACLACERALELSPGHTEASVFLADVFLEQGHPTNALDVSSAALKRKAEPRLVISAIAALQAMGRPREADTVAHKWLERRPDDLSVLASRCANMPGLPGVDGEAIARAHRAYGAALEHAAANTRARLLTRRAARARRHGPVRIGLVSPDLRSHPVATFLLPLLHELDPSRFEVFAYSTFLPKPDAATQRIRSLVASWRECAHLDDDTLAGTIADDQVDVLFDLAGLTNGQRLAVFARRPAPVQVAWLGYAGTTGLSVFDARLVDSITDPPGAEAHSSEPLIRLDPCFLCFGGGRDTPTPPPIPDRAPVFGSFNAMRKLHDGVLALWARLVRETPNATLLLKAPVFADARLRAEVAASLRRHGLEPSRFELRKSDPSHAAHLASYADMDVALDPFPYNGTTTTCEALLMGVPVVTLRGTMHAGRVSESLLRCVGGEAWIADSEDAYARTARELAQNRSALRALRTDLRARALRCDWCDAPAFARRFEAAVQGLHDRAIAS